MIILHLPPLRERGNDVLVLAQHYLDRFNTKYGKQVRQIDARAREQLLAYPWPGNVRELSHVIERAVLWSRGATLDAEHLSLATPVPVADTAERPDEPVPPPEAAVAGAPGLPPTGMDLGGWERAMIEQALRECEGNQTRAHSGSESAATPCGIGSRSSASPECALGGITPVRSPLIADQRRVPCGAESAA